MAMALPRAAIVRAIVGVTVRGAVAMRGDVREAMRGMGVRVVGTTESAVAYPRRVAVAFAEAAGALVLGPSVTAVPGVGASH